MHENMKTSMWHTGRSERTWRLPACLVNLTLMFMLFRPPNTAAGCRFMFEIAHYCSQRVNYM